MLARRATENCQSFYANKLQQPELGSISCVYYINQWGGVVYIKLYLWHFHPPDLSWRRGLR